MDKKKLLKGVLSIGAPLMLLFGFGKKLVSKPDKKVKPVHTGSHVKKMTIDSDQVAIPEVHVDTDDEEGKPKKEVIECENEETRDVGIVDDDEVALPLPKLDGRKRSGLGKKAPQMQERRLKK